MKNLIEWNDGKFVNCPICGSAELEVEDLLSHSSTLGNIVECRCAGCEQHILIVEGVGRRWRLLEPISERLHQGDNVSEEAKVLLLTDLLHLNNELISYLSRHPNLLQEISPRKFEELVAELLHRMGYDIELTPYSKDGGYDILAISKGEIGSLLTLVQCKRYRIDRPVGVEQVRTMIGVRDSAQASHAMIATTSSFTSGARELERRYKWQLSLHGFDAMTSWLRKYGDSK